MLLYCLPLFGSAMVQQLYSLVDLLVVGNFAENGDLAVDAIGNANVVINLLLAFALGANGGCSVIVAGFFGANNNKKLRESINTAIIAFSVLCAALMVIGFGIGGVSLRLLNVHGSYYSDCLAYLYIYVGSLPFVFFYNLGCGICSAIGDSKTPFIFLVISSLLNVGLDFLFVCVFHWDVRGAAWATFISQAISGVLTMAVVFRKMRTFKTEETVKKFDVAILKSLIITSIPMILQHCFVSLGNFFVNRRINDLGVDATTGFTTAFKLISMANMGVVSMTNGLTNYCAQNKAAGEYKRIKQGFVAVLTYTLITSLIFVTLFCSMPRLLTEIFIQQDRRTEEALKNSEQFMIIVSSFLPTVCVKIVCDGAVRGCGGNLGFTISTFADLMLRVVLVYVLTDAGWGFAGVCWAWSIGWASSLVFAITFWILRLRKIRDITPPVKALAVT